MIVAALLDSLLGALIGAAATFGAVLLAFWLPQRRRRADRVENLRIQGAQVTEPIRNLLLDLAHAMPGDAETVEELQRRWRDKLRDPLVAFGMAQNSAEISGRCLVLRDRVGDLLRRAQEAASTGSKLPREEITAVVEVLRELRVALGMDADLRSLPPDYYLR
jgi:hypothetical protein